MVMKVYADSDSHVKQFSTEISEYTALARSLGLPYWVWAAEEKPFGLVVVGKEPIRMFAPAGTQMAVIELIDTTQPRENLERFAKEAKQLAITHGAEYATIVLSSEKADPIESFKKHDFRVLADSYTMVSQLDRELDNHTALQFDQARREEARKWTMQASQFLKGSPDTVLELGLKNILDLPDSFIDLVFKSETFYFANRGNEAIGVLMINGERGTIGNIGVKSSERKKGYGRQIVTFGLKQLKASGCKQARLRVHAANNHAVHLYKSLGFEIKQRNLTLIWRKDARIAAS